MQTTQPHRAHARTKRNDFPRVPWNIKLIKIFETHVHLDTLGTFLISFVFFSVWGLALESLEFLGNHWKSLENTMRDRWRARATCPSEGGPSYSGYSCSKTQCGTGGSREAPVPVKGVQDPSYLHMSCDSGYSCSKTMWDSCIIN